MGLHIICNEHIACGILLNKKYQYEMISIYLSMLVNHFSPINQSFDILCNLVGYNSEIMPGALRLYKKIFMNYIMYIQLLV